MQLRETKAKPEKQDIAKRRASVDGQAIPARGKATHRSRRTRHPGKVCQGSRRQNHLTNHSNMTHVVDQCSVNSQDDLVVAIRHMAAISYKRNPQVTPVLRHVKRIGVKLAK